MPHWRATPLFKGWTTVIVAGGPSLSLPQVRSIGVARARNLIRVIAVNDAVYPCWFADVLYACDRQWWDVHRGVPGFDGRRLTMMHEHQLVYSGIDYLMSTGPEGIESDPGGLRTAGNSGYQAVNLAVHLGTDRILLVGYDMRGDAGSHWFGLHPEECRKHPPNFARFAKHFETMVEPLRAREIEVVNVTPGSAIGAFRRGDLDDELQRLEASMARKPTKPATKSPPPYVDRQMGGYATR